MMQEADCPILLLASGQSLKMRSVLLYEEARVRGHLTAEGSALVGSIIVAHADLLNKGRE